MSAERELAAIRRLVIAQLAMLCILAVIATAAAMLIVLRYDRPNQAGTSEAVKSGENFDPNLAMPIPTDRKSIVIVPREGETGPLHINGVTAMGAGTTVLWGPEEPADPELSAAQVQRRLRRIYPWRAEVPEGNSFKVHKADGHLLIESHSREPYKTYLQELDNRGRWTWRCELEQFDGQRPAGTPVPGGVEDIRVVAGTVVVRTERGFLGLRRGRTVWRRPMEGDSRALELAVDEDTAYLVWSEYDNRPSPQNSAELQARRSEGEWQKGRFAAINPATGKERWLVKLLDDDFLYPPTVMKNGTVVLSTRLMPEKSEQHLLAFSPSGNELWRYSEGDDQMGLYPPIPGADGAVYVMPRKYPANNDLVRLSPAGEVEWRVPVKVIKDKRDAGHERTFDLLYVDGDVIVAAQPDYHENHRDETYLVRLDGRSGSEVWRYRLENDPQSAPIMDRDGNIYCYTHYQLHALNSRGEPLWQSRTDVVSGDLHLKDGVLYVAGNMIQPYSLDGKRVEEIGIALYVPGGPGRHYCIGNVWFYRLDGAIQAVRLN